jgi:hypothetical protein
LPALNKYLEDKHFGKKPFDLTDFFVNEWITKISISIFGGKNKNINDQMMKNCRWTRVKNPETKSLGVLFFSQNYLMLHYYPWC